MPRKKPRNPLKRKGIEYDGEPDTIVDSRNRKLKKKSNKKSEEFEDDTPKSFKRLMEWSKLAQRGEPLPDGLDTGESKSTKQKNDNEKKNIASTLTIMPGEKMSDFSRRVNEALPIVKAKSKSKASKASKKTASKDTPIENNDEDDEDLDYETFKSRRDTSPDPWAKLQSDRPKFGDVVDAPPQLKPLKKPHSSIPNSVGSIAKRVALEDERAKVIKGYRELMEHKRSK